MNRVFLDDWSVGLSDREFACALAAVGIDPSDAALGTPSPDANRRVARLVWRLSPSGMANKQSARDALMRWRDIVAASPRIAITLAYASSLSFAQRFEITDVLNTIAEVEGVTIECDSEWTQSPPWRLPYSIASLERDSVAAWFADRERHVPPNWPFRYTIANKQNDRHSIVCVNAPIAKSMEALAQAPSRLKCNAVVVNGLGDCTFDSLYPLLQRLAARLSCSGIAICRDTLQEEDFARSVHLLALELTHDLPFDAALRHGFGNNAWLIGNASLLREARVSAQVASLSRRLKALPPTSSIGLSAPSRDMLMRAMPPPMDATPPTDAAMPPDAVEAAVAASAPHFEFGGESHEASALTELASAVRATSSRVVEDAASARYVQQQSYVQSPNDAPPRKIGDVYVLNESILLKIRIGSRSEPEWQSSSVAFPDQLLPANESSHRLTVMLHEPNYFEQPMLADIELPSVGASNEAAFAFTLHTEGLFEARITILHRGRVLQTALLTAEVLASRANVRANHALQLRDETRVRHDWTSLDRRPRYDLALVCNRDNTTTPRLTAVADKKAWATDLSGIDAPVAEINRLLSEVAKNTKDYGDGLDQGENPNLLVSLAFEGRELFAQLVADQLAHNTSGDFDLRSEQVTHIQIVGTRIDEVVPIEFVYDYELPADDTELTVCPEHRAALAEGQCKASCPGKQHPGQHVCPMGFWGIRKVIERHVFDAANVDMSDAPLLVRSETNGERNQLNIRGGALLGHSERVKPESVAPLAQSLEASVQGTVTKAKNWDEWAATIAAQSPQLLIAFPHNDGSGSQRKLELGGAGLRTTALTIFDPTKAMATPPTAQAKCYVRMPNAAAPLVFLLGCDTASTAEQFGSHVNAFRRAGAAIVVSTIATVFGEHAVKVGTSVARELLARTGESATPMNTDRLGEILRDAKRKALLESLPMALSVVAFGDADWKL